MELIVIVVTAAVACGIFIRRRGRASRAQGGTLTQDVPELDRLENEQVQARVRAQSARSTDRGFPL